MLQKEIDATVKLENRLIEHSKSVDSSVLGKYSLWRKENEREKSDSTVHLMRDQIIMAKVFSSIAEMKNKTSLHQELETQLKESQRVLGEANTDADLHHR